MPVTVRRKPVELPTYEPQEPDRNPMFFEKRVYQGSSGKIYPLPFYNRIAEKPVPKLWDAIHIENEFLYVMILPGIGGRIHVARDKTNGYDFIYRQDVIKPALVGLAGPWISGGIEFNWPQHHRPSTFMPADVEIEQGADGSATVWLSEHDPMARMKGMHGVCLRPESAVVELRARVYNRTPFVQTFLWWTNVATRAHEAYQSFFPPDVFYVADHAKRATSAYPLADGNYYGVPYGERGRKGVPARELPSQFKPRHDEYRPNDLSWYANIPVPTSYMCMGTEADFFGGYDHKARAGLVHVANHHISPGKKQWTWGNHAFGYAWDRNLTEPDSNGEFGPYIELMAGVYTDNQPDFSYLHPGETRSWTQILYPIREIGPVHQANADAAIHLDLKSGRLGVAVTCVLPSATIRLELGGRARTWKADLAPGSPFTASIKNSGKYASVQVLDADGRQLLAYTTQERQAPGVPSPATEPPAPELVASVDELYVIGQHLEQYRHATRSAEPYWREALRRDPGDSRCNNALGLRHLRRGEFATAETLFRRAIERLTLRNSNPYDGEAYYNLGLCLRHQGRDTEAYAAFYKAVWNQAWQAAGYHALAEIDAARGNWAGAHEHLVRAIRVNSENLRARNLQVVVARKAGHSDLAAALLAQTRAMDPLDWWARDLDGRDLACDEQVKLDLAHDCARAGLFDEALRILQGSPILSPVTHYTRAWLLDRAGNKAAATAARRKARSLPPDYCFPSRLEEIAVLEAAIRADPDDPRAPYYLGNLFYDRRRHREAIALWERAAKLDPGYSVVWRNLGIGCFNILGSRSRARIAYEKAFRAAPHDARLFYERDQLRKRLGEDPKIRLREFARHPKLVGARDDLVVEHAALLNLAGRFREALELLLSRNFQPWEGGEGQALGQTIRACCGLGKQALARGLADEAARHFEAALQPPESLGESIHLLANLSDVHYWLGCARQAQCDQAAAKRHWNEAAAFKGDFQEMSVRAFSEKTCYSALALEKLGHKAAAEKLFRDLLAYSDELRKTPAAIDYFATSLPALLLFEDDLQARQTLLADFLGAQALFGLGRKSAAVTKLKAVLEREPAHADARELLAEAARPSVGMSLPRRRPKKS